MEFIQREAHHEWQMVSLFMWNPTLIPRVQIISIHVNKKEQHLIFMAVFFLNK